MSLSSVPDSTPQPAGWAAPGEDDDDEAEQPFAELAEELWEKVVRGVPCHSNSVLE
jgi:hypothetical protein